MVIKSKLGSRQPFCPIILEVVHISSEVHLDLLVHPLSLPISLWVESSTGIHFHPDHGIELLHEMRYELRALVAHNFLRDSMVTEHSVPENPCHTESSEVDPNPFDQCPLCELVNNDKDHIMSTGEGVQRYPMRSQTKAPWEQSVGGVGQHAWYSRASPADMSHTH